jgi:hypothetical protein
MRAAFLVGALVLVGHSSASAQAIPGFGLHDNPISQIVSSVREKLAGPAAQPAPAARVSRSRTRRYRRSKPRLSRSASRRAARKVLMPRKRPIQSRQARAANAGPFEKRAASGPVHPPRTNAAVAPAAAVTVLRTRVVRRPIDRTVVLREGLLSLPVVETIGEPVTLDVPGIGMVDVPEQQYPLLFELLGSGDPAKQARGLQMLAEAGDEAGRSGSTGAR